MCGEETQQLIDEVLNEIEIQQTKTTNLHETMVDINGMLKTCKNSNQLVRILLNDLLNLAQIENNTFQLVPEFFNLEHIIKEAFGIL